MLLLPGALQIAQMGILVHLVREMMQQVQVERRIVGNAKVKSVP